MAKPTLDHYDSRPDGPQMRQRPVTDMQRRESRLPVIGSHDIVRRVNDVGSYLGRDAILKAAALRTEEVKVPEWADPGSGADVVLVRELRGRERDEWEASLAVQRGRDGAGRPQMVPDVANMRAKLVARCVVGEDGEPVFSQRDVAALGELSAVALNRVFEVAAKLSGLEEGALEEMAGNSGAVHSGDSPSA